MTFGRIRGVVEVHLGGEGGVVVKAPSDLDVRFFDQRKNGGSIPDCDNHNPEFYVGQRERFCPTAKEAREIEPEIDWDRVNNKVRSILRDVEREALKGMSGRSGVIFSALAVSPAEEKELLKRLRELGYGIIRVGDSYRIIW